MPSQYTNESTDLMPVDDLPGWRRSLASALAFGMDMLSARHELSWEEGSRAGLVEGMAQAEEAQRDQKASDRQVGHLEIRDVRERWGFHAHLDTQSTLTWTLIPRPLGH